jgi:small subunit ribosomal protein S8
MTMTDPIADMLTRLRNANQAYHDRVMMPYSKIKANIAEVLKSEGYVATWSVQEPVAEPAGTTPPAGTASTMPTDAALPAGQTPDRTVGTMLTVDKPPSVGKTLVVELKYGPNRERSLAGIRRVSKPGLRVYAKAPELPRVLGGLGVAIISTSQGLLTDRQARKRGVGGEVLAYVW